MRYETVKDRHLPDTWRTEAIDFDSEGEVYVAIFSGPLAEERAREYARWKNMGEGADEVRSRPKGQVTSISTLSMHVCASE